MSRKPFTLYGMTASLYTAKVRAYMRQQNIPFREVAPGRDEFTQNVLPEVGRWIIPVVKTPEGRLFQDGIHILDYLEESGEAKTSLQCDSSLMQVIAHVFELFGNEGLLRPAMHYRWNFDQENLDFIRTTFADGLPEGLAPEQKEGAFLLASGRMRKAAVAFGVTAETIPAIEQSYTEFLDLLEAHFQDTPYLLGGRATIGDYGLFGPLSAHLGRDPYPLALMQKNAPHVFRWIERMNAPHDYIDHIQGAQGTDLFQDHKIPGTLTALMRYVAEEYLPEITAHVDHANGWLARRPDLEAGTNGLDDPAARTIGMCTFTWRGQSLTSAVMPYRFYVLQRLQDHFDGGADPARKTMLSVLTETHLEPLLRVRTTRRVERKNHLEVWGK